LFLADAVQTWNDASGVPVEQRGFQNAEAVLNWTTSQQERGYLGATVGDGLRSNHHNFIEEFVLMGNSAGAVGAPVWAERLFNKLHAKKRAIVADSFVLFMPSNLEGLLLRDSANFCTSQLLPDSLSSSCAEGNLVV
jgi:hypothetical protein